MATLTVQIDKEKDLPALDEVLKRLGLEYQLEDNEWGNLSEGEIEGIKAGLDDVAAGRVHTHGEAMERIANKFTELGINR